MSIQETIENKKFSRRSFLKGLAALYATTKLSLCGNTLSEVYAEGEDDVMEEEEVWKNAPCWHNCGGTCYLKALVKDGSIVRLRSDNADYHKALYGKEYKDNYDTPQQRACVRGLAQKAQILGAERLKYPMVRDHFDPNGVTGKELRGVDTWHRVSWEEALDLVAEQAKKAYDVMGSKSIYVMDGGETARAFALAGGYMDKNGSRSKGCWNQAMNPLLGHKDKCHQLNDRYDLMNAKLIILWGSNPAQNSPGMPLLNLRRAKEAGVKIVAVDPMFSRTAALLADDFFPIRPATDTTLLLALSYIYLKEDMDHPEKKLVDWDFLNECTEGFDYDHMPADLPEEEKKERNYKDYVLGTYDKMPKTPEWASKICGLPVDRIYELAQLMMDNHPTTAFFAWNSARVEKAMHVCFAQLALGCLTGNVGIPGGAFGCSAQEMAANGGAKLVSMGKATVNAKGEPAAISVTNPETLKLCTNHHWQDILDGKTITGKGKTQDIDVRLVYFSHAACLNQTNNVNKGIQALRKVDCVVTNHFTFSPEAQFSDIVLPVTTPWEKAGAVLQGNREMIIFGEKVINPIGEAMDDSWIAEEIATRLVGAEKAKAANPLSEEQIIFNIIATTKVLKEDGKTKENLANITEADIAEYSKLVGKEITGKPQTGRVSILELKKAGMYQVMRHEGDNYGYIRNADLRKNITETDPAKKVKLKTTSGKLQIYSQALRDSIEKRGFDEGFGYAKYTPPTEGYEATFATYGDYDGPKGEYPYQIYAVHELRGTHSVFNQVTWLREAFPHDLLMNSVDAKANGLKDGDIVEVYNKQGTILRKLHVTERVMPGVLVIHEGAWVNLNKDGKCIAGSPNVLTGDFASGPDVESWNAVVCNVRKASEKLKADWQVDLAPHVINE